MVKLQFDFQLLFEGGTHRLPSKILFSLSGSIITGWWRHLECWRGKLWHITAAAAAAAKSLQLGLTLCDPMDYRVSLSVCPWDSLGKYAGVGCHFLLWGIFSTQRSNPCLLQLLHCRWILYCWAFKEGFCYILKWQRKSSGLYYSSYKGTNSIAGASSLV